MGIFKAIDDWAKKAFEEAQEYLTAEQLEKTVKTIDAIRANAPFIQALIAGVTPDDWSCRTVNVSNAAIQIAGTNDDRYDITIANIGSNSVAISNDPVNLTNPSTSSYIVVPASNSFTLRTKGVFFAYSATGTVINVIETHYGPTLGNVKMNELLASANAIYDHIVNEVAEDREHEYGEYGDINAEKMI